MVREYGRNGQVSFNSEEEFYHALGFLAANEQVSLTWEHNDTAGAWGQEGRIKFYDITNTPRTLSSAFSAGNGNIINRVNCNDYVSVLVNNHNFEYGSSQDIDEIRDTVPEEYMDDFNDGIRLGESV